MKRFSFSSLRFRLVCLVLIAVIPAWGFLLYTALEEKRLSNIEVQNHVNRLADFAAQEEERFIEEARQIIITLARFIHLHYSDPGQCSAFFADLLKYYRRYANFGGIKPNGEVFCSAVPISHFVNASDRAWFQHVIKTRDFSVGEYQVGRITGMPVMVFAYPVTDTSGQLLAVAFAAMDLKWLNHIELDVEKHLPRRSVLTKLDHRGIVLFRHPEPEKWVGHSFPDMNLVKDVLNQEKGTKETTDSEGNVWLHAFAPVRASFTERNVFLILSIPREVAYASSNRIFIRSLLWFGFVAAAALITAWVGSSLFILRRLNALVKAAQRLATGDLSARTGQPYGRGELSQLAVAFDEMAEALERHEVQHHQAEKEIRDSREQLRNLSLYLQTAREEERSRIAREIHDELGQALTALKIDLGWLSKRLPEDQHSLRDKTNAMSRLIDVIVQTVQRLSSELRPGVLDDLGLAAAIEWQAGEFQSRTGVQCHITINPEDLVLSKEKSTAIFRIFQEAVTNVIRHAHATMVEVKLEQQNSMVVLEVRDNGRGITEKEVSAPKSFGLIGIRERVRFWGGEVNIQGMKNKGTTVMVRIPMDREETPDDTGTNRG